MATTHDDRTDPPTPPPDDLMRAASALCRIYQLRLEHHAQAIANLIARELGRGDGEGNFRTDNYGERATAELARDGEGKLCCAACGSTDLAHFAWEPATRPMLGEVGGELFFDSDEYETHEGPGDAEAIQCNDCLHQHRVPRVELHWSRDDYRWANGGRDAFRHALGERFATDMFDPGTDHVSNWQIERAYWAANVAVNYRQTSLTELAQYAPDPRTIPAKAEGESR